LLLLSGAAYLNAFKPDQLQALALVFIRLRTIGFDIALVFFGFHCVALGYLLFRSTFFPRILGLLLAIGGWVICSTFSGTLFHLRLELISFPT
jgi:Domain of unknown function (DUF4386)